MEVNSLACGAGIFLGSRSHTAYFGRSFPNEKVQVKNNAKKTITK
jgi:hypothetical protein